MPYKSDEKRKEYQKKWNRTYYLKHTKKEKERTGLRRQKLREYVQGLKQNKSCIFCPENESVCLEFHHRDKKAKDFSLANAHVLGWSIEKINCEVEKCVLLCANCHRKVHIGKLKVE
ncbi:MAG: hypothetical protein KA052_02120 [Candidatus Pacebacteria bacterium]|nr:hypothetical protein [Candidatus Paceibacterota bacterium]